MTAVHDCPKKKTARQEWSERTYLACEKESPSQQTHCSVNLDSGCWTLPTSTAESKIQGPERWGHKPLNGRVLPRKGCEHRTLAGSLDQCSIQGGKERKKN